MAVDVLVRALLVGVALIFGSAVLFLIGHGIWLGGYRRWSGPRLTAAYRAVGSSLLSVGEPESGTLAALDQLPPSLRTRVLVQLSRTVSGESRARLSRIADDLGVLARARGGLHSRFWWRRLRAARTLQSLDAGGHPYLALLTDPHPAVRAQAAEWAAEEPGPQAAEALLSVFTREDLLPRFTAQQSLLRLGNLAVGPVAGFLVSHTGAEVIPALHVAIALAQPAFAAPAIRHCFSPLPEVRALAAELLGSVGGREGVETLTSLLADADFMVRASAARALGRIGHWPSAVQVAALLRDPEWEVRQAAGFALRALGSPGELMLRRYLTDSDSFAADMARQVLEIPDGAQVAR